MTSEFIYAKQGVAALPEPSQHHFSTQS